MGPWCVPPSERPPASAIEWRVPAIEWRVSSRCAHYPEPPAPDDVLQGIADSLNLIRSGGSSSAMSVMTPPASSALSALPFPMLYLR